MQLNRHEGTPQSRPIETDVHEGTSRSTQNLGLSNFIRLTPVQVGLKPKPNAKPNFSNRYMLSPGHTTKTSQAYTPSHFTENLSFISPPLSSPQTTKSHLTPNTCIVLKSQEHQPTQSSLPPPSSNPLKRKVIDKEFEFFSKRLKKQ